jgi:hypothetical protein
MLLPLQRNVGQNHVIRQQVDPLKIWQSGNTWK